MAESRFYIDLPVRYSDLDPQGHLNNARYLSFMEQARMDYLIRLELWEGKSFLDLGLIVADAHVAFLAPAYLNQVIRVWTRVTRLGNKSMNFEYELADRETGLLVARGDTVMVSYDYHSEKAIPIPDLWREQISTFESIPAQA